MEQTICILHVNKSQTYKVPAMTYKVPAMTGTILKAEIQIIFGTVLGGQPVWQRGRIVAENCDDAQVLNGETPEKCSSFPSEVIMFSL